MTQAAFAERTGINIGQFKKYEQDRAVPGGDSLAAIASTGVNLNWLLTGYGPMSFAAAEEPLSAREGQGAYRVASLDSLETAFVAVEEGLVTIGRTLSPKKKFELVISIANMLDDETIKNTANLINIVKLAA